MLYARALTAHDAFSQFPLPVTPINGFSWKVIKSSFREIWSNFITRMKDWKRKEQKSILDIINTPSAGGAAG